MIAFLLVATVVKLALATLPGGTVEIMHQHIQAIRWLTGEDVLDPGVSNPGSFLVGHYVLAVLAYFFAESTGTPFRFWIRVPAILADLGLALMLRAPPRGGDRAALVYMVSPVSLLLSVYHGQVHTVSAALAVCGIWLGVRGRPIAGGAVLGAAASVRQHFAVLLLPFARRLPRPLLAVIAFAAVVGLVNAPLIASPYLYRSLTPPSGYGTWGYTIVLVNGPRVLVLLGLQSAAAFVAPITHLLAARSDIVYFAWTAVFAWWVWRRPHVDPWRAALLFLTGFYAVSPGFGVQWLIWALPFWIVVSRRGAIVYSALAGSLLAVLYWVWRFNAKYGVLSVTANLGVLGPVDLALYLLAGVLGLATWAYCVRTAWRLSRA